MTQYVGIIGYPLKHSVSPIFQQAALDFYRLDIRYQVWETGRDQLGPLIERLRQPDYLGANVTIPYKEVMLGLTDEVDDPAKPIGAINTIVNRDGRLQGYNTDIYGFLRALKEDARFSIKNKRAVIIGAGGAARAVGFALLQQAVASVTITNRSFPRAQSLVSSLAQYALERKLNVEVSAAPWLGGVFLEAVRKSHLIVHCTSMGMKHSLMENESPLPKELISKDVLVYDLVYNPVETPLLRVAKEAGAKTLGGLPMLVYQGSASFELWTGKKAPLDIMMAAARQARVD